MNPELIVGRPGGSPLVNGYLAGEEPARAFFGGWWADPEAYLAKAREVAERFDTAARERAAAALTATGDAQQRRLEAWVREGGFAVTTGQQPGLFTGPLFTIYKALTAARLARALEPLVGAPVIPIFWVASEDHDWDESNHAVLVGLANELTKIEVDVPPADAGRPIHRIHPGEALPAAVRRLLSELPETDFSPPFAELLERAYGPGSTLSEGFGTVLGALLEPFGVYLADAANPALKRASAHLLLEEIEGAEAHERILAARADEIEAAGFDVQVPVLPGGVNLFVEGPAGRERLYRSDGHFHLRHSGESLSPEDLRARLESDPGSVSPNVLLRPVVESAVFPTLSLVTGPGETAYFAQLAPYFRAFGIEPPVSHPRFTVTAVETKVRKVLEKFGMDLPDVRRPFHEVAAEVARDELPEGARDALAAVRRAIEEGSQALAEAVQPIHTTLSGPVQRAKSASLDAWADAEKKILAALKRENETRLAQLEKAQLHLFPEGKPQERVLNVFYYLFRYGPGFLEELWERFEAVLPAKAPQKVT